MESPARPPKNTALHWIRGVAALVVVLSHLPYWAHEATYTDALRDHFVPRCGSIAVYVFFCLSGIVMMMAHGKEIGAPRKDRPALFAAFWIKRLFRLYPAFLVFALLNLTLYRLGFSTPDESVRQVQSAWQFFKAFTFLSTITVLAPAWSLHYEIFFYAVFSLFLLSTRAGQWICAALLLLTIAVQTKSISILGSTLNAMDLFFLLGIALFHLRKRPLPRGLALVMMGASLLLFGFVAGNAPHPLLGPLNLALCLVAVGVLFAYPVSTHATSLLPWLSGLGFGLGEISYSLYLGHFTVQTMLYRWIGPPRSFVAGSLFVLMPVAVAVLSYLCLERPVNRWGHRIAERVRKAG